MLKSVTRTAVVLSLLSLVRLAHAGDIFGENPELEQLWNEGTFTEGVAVAKDGRVYFSDISRGDEPGRVLRFDPATSKTDVYCADSGQSNGLMFDKSGRLLAACGANHGRRALCVIGEGGKVEELVTNVDGQHFNSPNDLVVHPRGFVFFSDPRYVGDEPIEFDLMWVFRFNPATGKAVRAAAEVTKPNGVIISPDGKTLYVAETNNGSPQFGERAKEPKMALHAYTIGEGGELENHRQLVEFDPAGGIDGMTMDTQGRIYAAFRNPERFGIKVINSEGKELDFLPTPDLPTNCCFGRNQDSGTLYLTIGTGLYRIKTDSTGFHTVK
ncbi:MAG: SMP-30/gluconolactonase/LRE family protein [Planctomycetaceae bacterium]|nr:SMP-30/gluconolactonase/LRE family protein [Planctomycetaceae bacterium]